MPARLLIFFSMLYSVLEPTGELQYQILSSAGLNFWLWPSLGFWKGRRNSGSGDLGSFWLFSLGTFENQQRQRSWRRIRPQSLQGRLDDFLCWAVNQAVVCLTQISRHLMALFLGRAFQGSTADDYLFLVVQRKGWDKTMPFFFSWAGFWRSAGPSSQLQRASGFDLLTLLSCGQFQLFYPSFWDPLQRRPKFFWLR